MKNTDHQCGFGHKLFPSILIMAGLGVGMAMVPFLAPARMETDTALAVIMAPSLGRDEKLARILMAGGYPLSERGQGLVVFARQNDAGFRNRLSKGGYAIILNASPGLLCAPPETNLSKKSTPSLSG